MTTHETAVYEFGEFRMDVRERQLLRKERPIPLTAKGFDTLRVLLERAGRLVTKDELLQQLWPDTVVEENNLNQNISVVRKALGEQASGQRYIETVPRVGYRFVAALTRSGGVSAPLPPPSAASARLHQRRRGPSGRKFASAPRRTVSASRIHRSDLARPS
jgi:DNA-binding winged helix-turn-helix (wHTH) protein